MQILKDTLNSNNFRSIYQKLWIVTQDISYILSDVECINKFNKNNYF